MESWQNTIMTQEHNSRNSAISEFQGTFLRNNFHRFPVSDIELKYDIQATKRRKSSRRFYWISGSI